ncbi:flagellar assembly peptidoglycan hydrolase FlgJ [Rhodoferax sp.]|uniref:flagellar assembly peptidoglycan hydrolase FlgJ n=1 Tax=Rhodoferax sp. TaxID=50421 RepID=UPI001EC3141E|nr:flagellar assembly peptidoglycan hydrolase FlgJ [Rhodoferax sp.]MBT9507713.1 flagellar assembly peptidoglycan hydrolase FlgJ [Rhodoferax sp.]
MGYGYLPSASSALAADARSLGDLKLQAGQNTPAAIRETAKQFESLFMRELIKSMREATMKSGLMDSPGGDLGADLLDQQFAVQMSGQPGGLSDLIAKQLSRQMGVAEAGATDVGSKPAATPPISARASAASLAAYGAHGPKATTGQTEFVRRHTEAAAKIEKASGIPAGYMVGQAGHETGWGKHEIKMKGGAPSFNLFGIKAGAGWTGKVAEVTTTEYVNGAAKKTVAKFRAYDSYEDSFRDYARLITQTPRYAQASQQTGSVQAFAAGLQKAGYATDPDYASKLGKAINTTLRLQRAQA